MSNKKETSKNQPSNNPANKPGKGTNLDHVRANKIPTFLNPPPPPPPKKKD